MADTLRALTIAVAQPYVLPHDVAANARAHAELVRAARARVVVFPELSLTGYELDAAVVDPGDARLAPLVAACAETGAVAFAGAPVAGEFIAMLAVDGEGARIAYRKMWLGDAEARRFVPGGAPAVVVVDGWRLGLAICKDTGVVEHAAVTADAGMDAYVAGVCERVEDAAVPGERAARIVAAHGIPVAIASFAGPAGSGFERGAGGSGVWFADGEPVVAGAEPGEFVRTTLRSLSRSAKEKRVSRPGHRDGDAGP